MEEFFKSLIESIRMRTSSLFIGTYSLFWAIYHWEGIFTLLFVQEQLIFQKYNLLKNEYLEKEFFNYKGLTDWDFYLGLLFPLLMTFLFIWVLPRIILIKAYKAEQEYITDKKKIRFDQEIIRDNFAKEKVQNESELLEAKVKLSKQEKQIKAENPQILWEKEYKEFKDTELFNSYKYILESVYKYSGKPRADYDEYSQFYAFEVPNDILVYSHTNDLITIEKGDLRLTEKGKFFAKFYSQDPKNFSKSKK